MTNSQLRIIQAAREACKSAVSYVGYYPEHCNRIGQRSPAALFECGQETWEAMQGGRYLCTMMMAVHIYINTSDKRLEDITNAQAAITSALLADITLGGTARCIDLVSVETGDWMTEFDPYSAGYSDTNTHRIVMFDVRFETVR